MQKTIKVMAGELRDVVDMFKKEEVIKNPTFSNITTE